MVTWWVVCIIIAIVSISNILSFVWGAWIVSITKGEKPASVAVEKIWGSVAGNKSEDGSIVNTPLREEKILERLYKQRIEGND